MAVDRPPRMMKAAGGSKYARQWVAIDAWRISRGSRYCALARSSCPRIADLACSSLHGLCQARLRLKARPTVVCQIHCALLHQLPQRPDLKMNRLIGQDAVDAGQLRGVVPPISAEPLPPPVERGLPPLMLFRTGLTSLLAICYSFAGPAGREAIDAHQSSSDCGDRPAASPAPR